MSCKLYANEVQTMTEKGTTNYKLNKDVEMRGKKMIDLGFHNTMSDLIEFAVLNHIIQLEKLAKETEN